jgi:signal transduction histidine kinase
VAAAFFAWKMHDFAERIGQPSEFGVHFITQASRMLVWALLTPLLLYVGHVLPIREPNRIRNALLVCVVAAGVALLRAASDGTLLGAQGSLTVPFSTDVIFAFAIVGITNFLRIEEEDNNRRHTIAMIEAAASEAVLRQLRADLSPHFLFNTLNGVATLLHSDPETAARMLDKIGDFLRSALATEHAREVRLEEELELVSSYFDLQRMRFGPKLTATIDISDPALREAAIPPMLLQPLVENAIIHGVARRRYGGCVSVLVTRESESAGERLRIDIRNDGPGFDPDTGGAEPRLGIRNVRTRLESMYGSEHSLTYLRMGDDFVARVLIPLKVKERP